MLIGFHTHAISPIAAEKMKIASVNVESATADSFPSPLNPNRNINVASLVPTPNTVIGSSDTNPEIPTLNPTKAKDNGS